MKSFILALCFCVASLGMSQATVINGTDIAGQGTFVDDITGYTWMDVNNYSDMTYAQVAAQLTATDFDVATESQLEQLFVSAGTDYSSVAALMGDVAYGGARILWGWFDDEVTSPGVESTNWAWSHIGMSLLGPSTYNDEYQMDGLGAWVVDTTDNPAVPEPATMVLFGLGILGLAGVSRKQLVR